MKKTVITTLALSIVFAGTASASSLSRDLSSIYSNLKQQTNEAKADYEKTTKKTIIGRQDPRTFRSQLERQRQLDLAIKLRQKNDFREQYIDSAINKDTRNQLLRHRQSRYFSNAPERSTQVKRTGALQDVPYYQYERPFSNPSTIRTNRTQVFKRRAVDYYLNQGYADSTVLRSGLIRADQHQVNRVKVPVAKTAAAQAGVLSQVRAEQRAQRGMSDQVPTGTQRMSRRVNVFGKNYANPFQFPYFVE